MTFSGRDEASGRDRSRSKSRGRGKPRSKSRERERRPERDGERERDRDRDRDRPRRSRSRDRKPRGDEDGGGIVTLLCVVARSWTVLVSIYLGTGKPVIRAQFLSPESFILFIPPPLSLTSYYPFPDINPCLLALFPVGITPGSTTCSLSSPLSISFLMSASHLAWLHATPPRTHSFTACLASPAAALLHPSLSGYVEFAPLRRKQLV